MTIITVVLIISIIPPILGSRKDLTEPSVERGNVEGLGGDFHFRSL